MSAIEIPRCANEAYQKGYAHGSNNMLQRESALIDTLPKPPLIIEADQQWISVEDAPKKDGVYWCHVDNAEYKLVETNNCDYFRWHEGEWYWPELSIPADGITHWMPLPQPPEEADSSLSKPARYAPDGCLEYGGET